MQNGSSDTAYCHFWVKLHKSAVSLVWAKQEDGHILYIYLHAREIGATGGPLAVPGGTGKIFRMAHGAHTRVPQST